MDEFSRKSVIAPYIDGLLILFHTGLRISEFCGLTLSDLDMENRIINVDHQLQRGPHMELYLEATKTSAGTRMLPMTEEVYECFRAIIEERGTPRHEVMISGRTGFLFLNDDGTPQVAMHWQHRFNHMVSRHNEIYKVQLPNITPHVCRHTYCSNMAKSGMIIGASVPWDLQPHRFTANELHDPQAVVSEMEGFFFTVRTYKNTGCALK